jgi:hypothetical protein
MVTDKMVLDIDVFSARMTFGIFGYSNGSLVVYKYFYGGTSSVTGYTGTSSVTGYY